MSLLLAYGVSLFGRAPKTPKFLPWASSAPPAQPAQPSQPSHIFPTLRLTSFLGQFGAPWILLAMHGIFSYLLQLLCHVSGEVRAAWLHCISLLHFLFDFSALSHRFRFNFCSVSLHFLFDFASMCLQFLFDFSSCSLTDFAWVSLQFFFGSSSLSSRFHSISLRVHRPSRSLQFLFKFSYRFRFKFF